MTQVNPRFVLLLLALAGLALNGCEPGTQPGPGDTGTDGGDHGGDGGDTEPELTEPRGAEASLQIQVVRDVIEEDATLDPPLPVEGVAVTYVRPQLGEDPAGFFVQGEAEGPALFVAVDPSSLEPSPQVGDLVSFRVESTTVVNHQHRVTGVGDFTLRGTGYDVTELVQDVSGATDLVTGLDRYESELLAVEARVEGALEPCGASSVCADIATEGVPGGEEGLRFRIPEALVAEVGLRPGCTVAVGPTPLWRFEGAAQVSAWVAGDVDVFACAAFEVRSAIATGPSTITVRFSAAVAPATVTAAAFTASGGLTILNAVVDGDTVMLTTSAQTPDAVYSLHIDETLTDVDGNAIAADTTVEVPAFRTAAGVLVNEAELHAADGCDLVELRVVAPGPMGGVVLRDRTATPLIVFPEGFFVQKNDLIVVHLNRDAAACNGGGVPENELEGPDTVNHPSNLPGAYDFWAERGDVDGTSNVLFLLDGEGDYLDFVAFVAASGTISGPHLDAANSAGQAGEWPLPPAGFYGTSDFRTYAVGYEVPPAVVGTLQRLNDADTHNKTGWGQASASFGALNGGQTLFP